MNYYNLTPCLPLCMLLIINRILVVDAWTPVRSNQRFLTFKLLAHSEDVNHQRLQLENVFYKDMVDYEIDDTVHIGGLYESLSILPVHDWQESEFDFTVCHGDECEVS